MKRKIDVEKFPTGHWLSTRKVAIWFGGQRIGYREVAVLKAIVAGLEYRLAKARKRRRPKLTRGNDPTVDDRNQDWD